MERGREHLEEAPWRPLGGRHQVGRGLLGPEYAGTDPGAAGAGMGGEEGAGDPGEQTAPGDWTLGLRSHV